MNIICKYIIKSKVCFKCIKRGKKPNKANKTHWRFESNRYAKWYTCNSCMNKQELLARNEIKKNR